MNPLVVLQSRWMARLCAARVGGEVRSEPAGFVVYVREDSGT